MPQSGVELIIWDLDGTLVDSLPATFTAFNAGLEPFLGKKLSPAEIMSHFGPPDQEILRKLVGDANADRCYELMLGHMLNNIHDITPFQGVVDAILNLQSPKYKHGIFTGRGKRSTEVILDHLGLKTHFMEIVTNDDVSQHKPHPEGVLKICATAGVHPSKAVMIGDSHADILAGRAAGARTVSCLWDGNCNFDRLREHQPDYMITRPGQLLDWLEALAF